MQEQDLRDDYFLNRDWTLLNNGSFGACPRPVFRAYQYWQVEFERHPGEFVNRWQERMDSARSELANFLHTEHSNLGFVTNATMGVNVVAHSMQSVLQPGDEVLTTDHEYGACNHAWQFNCARSGAAYINQHIPLPLHSTEEFVELLWAGVTPRTRVISLSHITSPTALTFPVQEICRRARVAGILTVVDGAHVPGQRNLYLDDLGADFYVGNCHKWMCGPKGTAFLYVCPEAQPLIEPLIVGHGWLPDERSKTPLIDYVEQYGTRDLAGFLAIPAALEYMQRQEWHTVRARCHDMALDAKRTLESFFNTESICPESFEWFSQLCPIRLPNQTDMAKLSQIFREQYKIEMPLITWQDIKIARLSVQVYTSQREIDTVIRALKQHVPETMVE